MTVVKGEPLREAELRERLELLQNAIGVSPSALMDGQFEESNEDHQTWLTLRTALDLFEEQRALTE